MPIKQVYIAYDRMVHTEADRFKYCPVCGTALVLEDMDGVSRNKCPSCGFIRFKNPAPAVSILILQDDQVLLGKRLGEPGKGKWAVPSGYIEYDDDFLTTGIREAKEETGLDVEIKSIVNVSSSFLSPRYHFLAIYLLGHVIGGSLAAGDDLETVEWFSLSGPWPDLAFQEDIDVIEAFSKTRFEGLPVDPNFAKAKGNR